MDPRLTALVDLHDRRLGAPAELIAILGPERSQVMVDGVETTCFGRIPADRLCLAGQLGGMIVERDDDATTVTVALAGGPVHCWWGESGNLQLIEPDQIDIDSVAAIWRALDPEATLPLGPEPAAFSEVAARALLVEVIGEAMVDGDCSAIDDAIAAFIGGELRRLARLAGVVSTEAEPNANTIRQILVMGGCRRVPLPGSKSGSMASLHAAVPYRWQIAADLAEYLGRPDAANEILWGPTGVRWTELH